LQIEEPIVCRYSSAFHFQPTWTSVLGPTLIGDEVVEVGQPRETRLWTATGMMEPFHREQLPLDGVVGLIQEGAGDGPLRVCEDRLPARFRVLKPLAHPVAVGLPCGVGDMLGNVTSPLAQGKHPPALPRSHAVQHGMKRRAQRLAHRGRDRRQLLRELMDRLAQAVAQARSWEERTHPLGGAVEAIGAAPPDPLRRLRLGRRALTRLIRPGQGGRTGLRRLAQMPEDAAAGDRGHIDLVGQTAAVLFIDQARAGQGQATPGEHRHQTRVAERTDQAIDGHGGAMAEHGTPCHTQATVRGQHGIAGDLRSPLALAQDDMWEDGAHRCACRALETPDRDATQTDTPIMRMTRQALSPITGRLVWELKAEDQEAGEHPFDTRLAVFDQAAGGRFVSKITGDGAVFSRRFGRCAHGLPRCHQVSCADGTRCGSHVDISRPS